MGLVPGTGDRPLRIAMIGQRGLPPTHGGVEHHVANLGRRLAERGHQVTVYCRTNYVAERHDSYEGMRLRHLPTVGTKHLDAIVHSLASSVAATATRPDIVHFHALGPGLGTPLPRFLSGAKVVQTVHGLDDRRAKWSGAAKAVLRSARWVSDRVPDAVVAVSREVADAYAESRHGLTVHVPNGVEPPRPAAPERLSRFGLAPRGYVLFVGRLVPEKAPDLLVQAFRGLPCDISLVVAGGSSYTGDFVERLTILAQGDPRVALPGYVYGEDLAALYANAAVFVQPSSMEGLPLTLLEALSHAVPVVASDIAPHREVLGGDGPGGRLFRAGDRAHLRDVLAGVLAAQPVERAGAAVRSADTLARFSWDAAASATEELYLKLVGRSVQPARRVRQPID